MSYFFWKSTHWFSCALCCRYLVVRFDRLRIPMRNEGTAGTAEWHWALGLFTDGRFEVLGAWRDEGAATAQRIATDIHDRGVERIKALAGNDSLVAAMEGFRPKVCRSTVAELAECSAFGPRMRQAIRWTDAATQQLQNRMQRVIGNQPPFADDAAAAEFIAQAFQRADRDLLDDRWGRARPAPYGASASAAALAAAA
ncbi:transposase [Pelomonas sp. P7]|uniref:Transposase n=1 Tax=Pelomonas caseinilytica TaxID=2906763 RepID=A0ABS8XIY3_9BURK|nr:transposase [Pelomonas sp. P7]MCE4538528.1 transposase [Pelomonas sp. P7]